MASFWTTLGTYLGPAMGIRRVSVRFPNGFRKEEMLNVLYPLGSRKRPRKVFRKQMHELAFLGEARDLAHLGGGPEHSLAH